MKIKSIKANVQKGFTLIELMITVAIVGILAAVALPAYQDYTIRAQVSEGYTLAGGLQTSITEFYANNGVYPATNATVNVAAPTGKYVTGITSALGVITVTYGGQANAKIAAQTMSLTAVDDGNGNIKWTCAAGTVPAKYLPSSCN